MSESTVAVDSADLQESFPAVDPGAKPLGARVLVQLRKAKKRVSKGGIILAEETRDTERAQNPVGKVVAIGPLAFKKRDTMESWPEGSWCEIGDYVRVPKWTGDRWEVRLGSGVDEDAIEFMIMNDHEVIAKITGNPLEVRAFV
jgi:co-chaperonin GroES (HSP10)